MKISYEACIGGEVEIYDSELEGLTKDERRELIAKRVTAEANEELDSTLTWESFDDELELGRFE